MLLDHACYHLDLFNAGYRQLLLFFVPMFLAGYAQDTDVYVFWGSWACLILLLWEPYLSPPFPWVSPDAAPDETDEAASTATSHDPPQQDVKAGPATTKAACLQDTINVHHDSSSSSSSTNHPCGQVLGGMEHGATARPPAAAMTVESEAEHAAARDRERKQRRQKQVNAWKWAVLSSVPGKQHGVYRLMHVLLIAPVVAVILGVSAQHASCSKAAKMLATCPGGATLHYSSDLLAALLALYLLLVLSSCVLFVVFFVPHLKPQGTWQPADMLFFICKILGSALNTIVQSLVAGSFVSFMTTSAFWLCMAITGMSYVATDLLFDLEGEPPVGELWGPLGVLTSRLHRQPGHARRGGSSRVRHGSATSGPLLPTLSVCDNTSVVISPGTLVSRGAAAAGPDGPSKDTSNSAAAAAAAHDNVAGGGSAIAASEERAPFLVYRRPAGWRGFTIIALLVAVAAPCVVILVQLVWQPESLLVAGSGCEGQCYKRYVQLMYALCCMGLLSCYYSLTVGCIGMGPVEFVFVMSKHTLKKHR